MICMTPIAPALDVMGRLSSSAVRPPLSMRMTARIQSSATPKRRDASLMRGVQRSRSCFGLIACSALNFEGAAVPAGFGLAKAALEDASSRAARADKQDSFTTLGHGEAAIDHPEFRAGKWRKRDIDLRSNVPRPMVKATQVLV